MSETLTWNFTGNDRLTDLLDKLSVTLSSVDRKLSDFGKTSTKVKGETQGLEDEVKGLGDQTEKTGDKVKRAFRGIDEELAVTAVELKALQREFAATGDTDLFAKISDKKSYQSKLKSVAKDLASDAEQALSTAAKDASEGGSFLSNLVGNVQEAVPGLAPVMYGVGIAMAVPLLAGIGGAITAAAGAGIAGAGVAGAVMGDPGKFGAEWNVQISALKHEWIDASKVFAGPTLDAIRSIGPTIQSWHLDQMLAKAAGYVQPLVSGFEGFATEIMSGVDALVSNAGPEISMLAEDLPAVGAMIADGLKAVADNSDGGAKALGDLLQLAGGLADAVLHVVAGAELMYEGFKTADVEVSGFMAKHRVELGLVTFGTSELALAMSKAYNSDEVEHFGQVLPGVTVATEDQADAAKAAKQEMQGLSDAFDAIINETIAAENATLAFNKDLLGLSETVKKNGHDISETTDKGIANRQYVLQAIGDAERSRKANIDNGMSVVDATAKYDAQIETLKTHLRQMGFTEAQIKQLTEAANNVPSEIDIQVNLKGASAAGAVIGNLIKATGGKLTGSSSHRALGGAVMPGGIYEVNEQGVETFQPNSPGTIVPAGAGGSDPDVLGVVVVRHETPSGEVIRTELLTLKRRRGLAGLGLG